MLAFFCHDKFAKLSKAQFFALSLSVDLNNSLKFVQIRPAAMLQPMAGWAYIPVFPEMFTGLLASLGVRKAEIFVWRACFVSAGKVVFL